MWNWPQKRRTYLDYASAPPVSAAAVRAMRDAEHLVGNPGAIHAEAVAAKAALENARERIAALLEVKPRELVFTSGLTESNNLAIIGAARNIERVRRALAGTHWLVSSIEHSSVLDCFAEVERMGGTVAYLEPDERGIIDEEKVRKALKPETVFVSIGWANNEIGSIQPLAKIARVIRAHEEAHASQVLLHTDAGQAPLYLSTTAHSLGVDLMSIGGNKLYGPHGVGAFFASNRAELIRPMQGGPQERGLRPGTENVALALGFAAAYEESATLRHTEAKRLRELRDAFAKDLVERIPGLIVNGDLRLALPHMLNISIPNISSEYVTLALDAQGIAVSTKSACREGEESRSHAVAALGRSPTGETLGGEKWRAENTLRFSLGRHTTTVDVQKTAQKLAEIVHRGL